MPSRPRCVKESGNGRVILSKNIFTEQLLRSIGGN